MNPEAIYYIVLAVITIIIFGAGFITGYFIGIKIKCPKRLLKKFDEPMTFEEFNKEFRFETNRTSRLYRFDSGYQPEKGKLDKKNPPKGGSGVRGEAIHVCLFDDANIFPGKGKGVFYDETDCPPTINSNVLDAFRHDPRAMGRFSLWCFPPLNTCFGAGATRGDIQEIIQSEVNKNV